MQKERFPLGWEVLRDEDKKVFFVLGQAQTDDNVHNLAVRLNEEGYTVSDHCPLLKTFPTKVKLIEYFESVGYKYIEDWQTYYYGNYLLS